MQNHTPNKRSSTGTRHYKPVDTVLQFTWAGTPSLGVGGLYQSTVSHLGESSLSTVSQASTKCTGTHSGILHKQADWLTFTFSCLLGRSAYVASHISKVHLRERERERHKF